MRIIGILFLIAVVGCDSPRNHRVTSTGEVQAQATDKTFAKASLKVSTRWISGPYGNIQKPSALLVTVTDLHGQRTDLPTGLSLYFYSTMPSMGHPLDQPGEFKAIASGVYLNESIVFNMPGDWNQELWLMDAQFVIQDQVSWLEVF